MGGSEVRVLIIQLFSLLASTRCDECQGLNTPVYLDKTFGRITSPRYPAEHPSNQRCQWIFTSFTPGDILQLSINEISLHWFPIFSGNYLKLPNGTKLKGNHRNICILFGVYKSIRNCSENVNSLKKQCNYHPLQLKEIPPKITFETKFSIPFLDSKGFSLNYKIWNCIGTEDTTRTTATTVTSSMDADSYIITATTLTSSMDADSYITIPSAIAIFVFAVAGSTVGLFLYFSRKNLAKTPPEGSITNVYETEPHGTDRPGTYESIPGSSNPVRRQAASYLSQSELVSYPRQELEIPAEDGYVDIEPSGRIRSPSTSSRYYVVMKKLVAADNR